jgi:hypothetical protein
MLVRSIFCWPQTDELRKTYSITRREVKLVSSNVVRLRRRLRMSLSVNPFELPNRNRSPLPKIPWAVVRL